MSASGKQRSRVDDESSYLGPSRSRSAASSSVDEEDFFEPLAMVIDLTGESDGEGGNLDAPEEEEVLEVKPIQRIHPGDEELLPTALDARPPPPRQVMYPVHACVRSVLDLWDACRILYFPLRYHRWKTSRSIGTS